MTNILLSVFHKKGWPTYIQIPCARKGQILFKKKKKKRKKKQQKTTKKQQQPTTLILPKSSLKLMSSTCSNFLLPTYLLRTKLYDI